MRITIHFKDGSKYKLTSNEIFVVKYSKIYLYSNVFIEDKYEYSCINTNENIVRLYEYIFPEHIIDKVKFKYDV